MVTAVLGALIFSEALPGLWWLGAAFLVAGSVIIGRREETNKAGVEATTGIEPILERDSVDGFRDEVEEEANDDVELNVVKDPDTSDTSDDDGVLK